GWGMFIRGRSIPSRSADKDALVALGATAAACLVALVAGRWIGLYDLSMVYIVAVVMVAARSRSSSAVTAAALCFLCLISPSDPADGEDSVHIGWRRFF
ncbi:hypothetical protein, partial [Leclercia adecarboxylata]|uniref:hypothetical protein n=1 Tax=Leclercia adecarboxylata TaxID=83655 RepID=UPI00234DD5F7